MRLLQFLKAKYFLGLYYYNKKKIKASKIRQCNSHSSLFEQSFNLFWMFWSCGHNSRQFLKISQYWHYTFCHYFLVYRGSHCLSVYSETGDAVPVQWHVLCHPIWQSQKQHLHLWTVHSLYPAPTFFQMVVLRKQCKWRQVLVWWSAILEVNCTHIYATASCQWTQEVYWTVPKRQQ